MTSSHYLNHRRSLLGPLRRKRYFSVLLESEHPDPVYLDVGLGGVANGLAVQDSRH